MFPGHPQSPAVGPRTGVEFLREDKWVVLVSEERTQQAVHSPNLVRVPLSHVHSHLSPVHSSTRSAYQWEKPGWVPEEQT